MNILVTGACGQLGNSMRVASIGKSDNYIFSGIHCNREESDRRLKALYPAADVSTLSLDITDEKSVRNIVEQFNIDVIVNCAAYTNVDKAETDYAAAYALNAIGPSILAKVMAERDGLLIHVSTDYVYSGMPEFCKEDGIVLPLNKYGASKLAGEQSIAVAGCRHIILRTSWLYSVFGNNFVEKMRHKLFNREPVKVVIDQVGSPTYAQDLADAICSIIEGRKYKGNYGVYNYCNRGVCSWYGLTEQVAIFSDIPCCGNIEPCFSSSFHSDARRPSWSAMDTKKFRYTFMMDIPEWRQSLKCCLWKLDKI